jgi:cytidylate kinase
MAILTISRQHGSRGGEIGRLIARETGYEYIDREKFLDDIRTRGQDWEKWGKEFDEHRPSVWERYDRSFKGFVALQQSIIFSYAVKDRVVIMGRGANFLLQEIPYVLKVRFEAPLDNRIERFQNRENADRATAEWMLQKLDKEADGFIRNVYSADWRTHAHYDIIFNTAIQSQETIVVSVKTALLEKDKLKSEEAIRLLGMKALAKSIKASILTNPKLFVTTLDVLPVDDTIILRGVVHSAQEHRSVEEQARELAGAIPVKCELHYR